MLALPIDPVLPDLVATLLARRTAVLQAPPGAGKTTRAPAALLDALPTGEIVVLEPRRLAARHSARRVAEERGVPLGGLVGYDVRFDRALGPATRLSYVTEGILTRRLLERGARGLSAIVLDEFHERHLASDVALGLARIARREHPELVVLVMSATLDAAPVARFLDDAPLVTSGGRAFPVEVEHLERVDDRPLALQVVSAVRRALRESDGDVLVFLPGTAEIRAAQEATAKVCADALADCLPLYGELPPDAQDRAIAPGARRKVILSTNVAETSVTIPGVTVVVDSGLARIAGHDPWTGRPTLEVRKVARSSAIQRAGRAGRVRAGRCLRLYTKGDFESRPEHDAPEVSRLDLAETMLSLGVAGHDPRTFPWLTRPSDAALDAARALLLRLGAIDDAGAPTKTGRAMARLPLAPRLARLVVEGAARGVAADACGVAAMLSLGRDVYGRDREARMDEPCDASARLRDLGDRHVVEPAVAASVRRVQRQLEGLVDGSRGAFDPDVALRTAILAAFPDRVARRRGHGETLVLSSGGQATLSRSSVVRTAPWVVAVEALDRRGTSTVTMATAIEPDWLIDLFPERIAETTEVRWDDVKERVEAVERMAYDKLTLDERPTTAGPAVAALLAERALAVGLDAFVGGAFSELSARIAFVARTAKDLAEDAGLLGLDPGGRELLVAACAGRRSFAELREGDLLAELRAALGHGPLARLDQLAPTHVVLGNGRRAAVTYPADAPPSISSRLQDFFGSADGPRVLAGRVPVVLHLLAPNGRDVQVTTDLAGFWDRHYPGIRNELRRRYPRHAWPDDPRTAAPPELRRR